MKHIMTAVFVVIVGAIAVVFLFQSEESKVKKQFNLLSKRASKKPDEEKLAMAVKAKQLQRLFAKNCGLRARIYSVSGDYTPEEISSLALAAFSQYSRISLKFYDVNIDFTEDGIARVAVTANLAARLAAGEHIDDTHQLECVLEKVEDSWLFSDFEVVEVLEK